MVNLFFKGIFIIVILLIIIAIIKNNRCRTQLTPFFIIIKKKNILWIYQYFDHNYYKKLKMRIKNSKTSLSREFSKQLHILFDCLIVGEEYITNTHLINVFVKAQRQDLLAFQIIGASYTKNIWLEVLLLRGLKNTLKIIINKKYRNQELVKQFYRIKFKITNHIK